MNATKGSTVLAWTLLISVFAYSQAPVTGALKVGDVVPALVVTVHMGDVSSQLNFRDLRGKAILLSYWGPNCSTCIAEMPRLYKYQAQYPDKLKVILVTSSSAEEISALWKGLSGVVPDNIPEAAANILDITSDTTINKLFALNGLNGLKVWIDSNSIFRAVTNLESVTANNVHAFVTGGKTKFIRYTGQRDMFAPEDWFAKRMGYSDHLISYSIFLRYDEKYSQSGPFFVNQLLRDSVSGKILGLSMVNADIIGFYKMAYFHEFVTDNQIYISAKQRDRFYPPHSGDSVENWQKKNLFCYALKLSPDDPRDVFDEMKKQINEFFGLSAFIESREVGCFMLRRKVGPDLLQTKGGIVEDSMILEGNIRKLVLRNQAMSVFMEKIRTGFASVNYPGDVFFDETGYTKNIDLDIPWAGFGVTYNLEQLNGFLKFYGLELVPDKIPRKVLVIRDK